MTEEEFKIAMRKIIIFVVISLVILVVIGFMIFNTSGKTLSIFKDEAEKENYQKKVEELNSNTVTEEKTEENNASGEEQPENAEQPAEEQPASDAQPTEEQPAEANQ